MQSQFLAYLEKDEKCMEEVRICPGLKQNSRKSE